MKIQLYPSYESVFTDQQLKGIFYPLCTVELDDDENTQLFFVSSNGIWINEDNSSENNSSNYTKFNLVNSKYQFNGNIELYAGYEIVKDIFKILETDFEENGKKYLEGKIKTDKYINQIKPKISIQGNTQFDIDYYLQTFYEFSLNKLNFKLTNNLGTFREVIEGWGKSENNSPIVYEVSSDNNSSYADIEINAEFIFPPSINLSDYKKIGQVMASEFFTDGNDSILLYNPNDKTVLIVNNHS